MHNLYRVLLELDAANIHYHLGRYREDYVTVHATLVGKRLEIDVSSDGEIETAIFSGSEDIKVGMEYLLSLIAKENAL